MKRTGGFTLIELLVVIAIIGILSSLALVSYSGAQRQARDSQRRSDLAQYRNGLENFATANDSLYPVEASTVDMVDDVCPTLTTDEHLSSCPDDPVTGRDYLYLSDANGTEYVIL